MSGLQDHFGSPAQRAVLARGLAMHQLTREDPRFTYYGRAVGLADHDADVHELLTALIHLQGSGSLTAVASERAADTAAAFEMSGMGITRYRRLEGGAEALASARGLSSARRLPDGLSLVWVTPDLPNEQRAALAETALACGVLPPSLGVLSGRLRPGVACMAVESSGRVVSCAAAAGYLHPDHSQGRDVCWWGMLATRPERRGFGLSLTLGALAMTEMAARYGYSRFMTGVERGNAASEAICAKMGLEDRATEIIVATDPAHVPGGRMTR